VAFRETRRRSFPLVVVVVVVVVVALFFRRSPAPAVLSSRSHATAHLR
jgi:hypothetical protein